MTKGVWELKEEKRIAVEALLEPEAAAINGWGYDAAQVAVISIAISLKRLVDYKTG